MVVQNDLKSSGPHQDLSEWASIYIKYVRVLGKLETVYDQMVHPQKRQDVKQALEACIGRTVAVRHWLVSSAPGNFWI